MTRRCLGLCFMAFGYLSTAQSTNNQVFQMPRKVGAYWFVPILEGTRANKENNLIEHNQASWFQNLFSEDAKRSQDILSEDSEDFWGIRGKRTPESQTFSKKSVDPNSVIEPANKRNLKPNSLFGTYKKKTSLKPNSLFGTYR